MVEWPDLRDILSNIPWVVAGGVATRAYMPERTTRDLDILVAQKDGPKTMDRLQQAGYQIVARLAIPGYQLRSPGDVEVDVLFGDFPWLAEALQEPAADPAGYPVLALPYLVLMKLDAQRMQDWADVSRMLGWATESDLEAVRAVISRYRVEDLEDLEALIYLGRQEREAPASSSDAIPPLAPRP